MESGNSDRLDETADEFLEMGEEVIDKWFD